MYKYASFFLACSLILFSCKKDNDTTCTQCSSDLTPTFEVCSENDGSASVNGENTGIAYDVYIAALEEAGTTCGG